jgi:hypothetical protein
VIDFTWDHVGLAPEERSIIPQALALIERLRSLFDPATLRMDKRDASWDLTPDDRRYLDPILLKTGFANSVTSSIALRSDDPDSDDDLQFMINAKRFDMSKMWTVDDEDSTRAHGAVMLLLDGCENALRHLLDDIPQLMAKDADERLQAATMAMARRIDAERTTTFSSTPFRTGVRYGPNACRLELDTIRDEGTGHVFTSIAIEPLSFELDLKTMDAVERLRLESISAHLD